MKRIEIGAKEVIAEFLKARIDLGQAEYEMVTDGYDGDIEAYIEDYADDYEVLGGDIIHRIGYDEYYTADGKQMQMTPALRIFTDGLYDAAVQLMDNDIREAVHRDLAPCTALEFIEEYMRRHEKQYGEPFTV